MRALAGLEQARSLIVDLGAKVVLNTSGGKDSQLMYLRVREQLVTWGCLDQLYIVHADLGRVEHSNSVADIQAQLIGDDVLHVVQATFADGSTKDLISMIRRKRVSLLAAGKPDTPPVPDKINRTCTSDLKRGPVLKFINNVVLGDTKGSGLVVNCMGFRAQESDDRAQAVASPVEINDKATRVGPRVQREVFNWYPIADYRTFADHTGGEVFTDIHAYGQRAWSGYLAEGGGNQRKSCVFCILGCKSDWIHGAKLRPELAQELSDLETEIGFTLLNGESVKDRLINVLEIN